MVVNYYSKCMLHCCCMDMTIICPCTPSRTFICDRFWENQPKLSEQFFSVSQGKALWVDFFKTFMAEMDKHWLALAYGAAVSSGEL